MSTKNEMCVEDNKSTTDILTDLVHEIMTIQKEVELETPFPEIQSLIRKMFDNAFSAALEVIKHLDNQDDMKQKFTGLKHWIDVINRGNFDQPNDWAMPIFTALNINELKNAFKDFLDFEICRCRIEDRLDLRNVSYALRDLNVTIFEEFILLMDACQFYEGTYVNQK